MTTIIWELRNVMFPLLQKLETLLVEYPQKQIWEVLHYSSQNSAVEASWRGMDCLRRSGSACSLVRVESGPLVYRRFWCMISALNVALSCSIACRYWKQHRWIREKWPANRVRQKSQLDSNKPKICLTERLKKGKDPPFALMPPGSVTVKRNTSCVVTWA